MCSSAQHVLMCNPSRVRHFASLVACCRSIPPAMLHAWWMPHSSKVTASRLTQSGFSVDSMVGVSAQQPKQFEETSVPRQCVPFCLRVCRVHMCVWWALRLLCLCLLRALSLSLSHSPLSLSPLSRSPLLSLSRALSFALSLLSPTAARPSLHLPPSPLTYELKALLALRLLANSHCSQASSSLPTVGSWWRSGKNAPPHCCWGVMPCVCCLPLMSSPHVSLVAGPARECVNSTSPGRQ